MMNNYLMCGTAGIQSGTRKPVTEKLPPTGSITPSGSSASDLQDSGVVICLYCFRFN